MYIRVSLRGMLRLIRVDTLRRVHNVGFLTRRLKYIITQTRVVYFIRLYFPLRHYNTMHTIKRGRHNCGWKYGVLQQNDGTLSSNKFDRKYDKATHMWKEYKTIQYNTFYNILANLPIVNNKHLWTINKT